MAAPKGLEFSSSPSRFCGDVVSPWDEWQKTEPITAQLENITNLYFSVFSAGCPTTTVSTELGWNTCILELPYSRKQKKDYVCMLLIMPHLPWMMGRHCPKRVPVIYKLYILGGAENSFQPAIECWDSAVELVTSPNWEGARDNYSMPTHLSSWFTRWSYVALGDLWLFHPNIVGADVDNNISILSTLASLSLS